MHAIKVERSWIWLSQTYEYAQGLTFYKIEIPGQERDEKNPHRALA